MVNNNVFRNLSYGVYVVSTLDGTRPTGCVANSIMQITSSPATFAVSMNHDNYTNACIKKTGKFAISILSEQSNSDLIGIFGFQSGKDVNKFEGVDAFEKEGLSIVSDSCGYIVCKVIDQMETSTHTVFLGEAVAADTLKKEDPMTYAYYHKHVKPQPEKATKAGWRCKICGYVYEGEILPDDFICPLCKHGASDFEKL